MRPTRLSPGLLWILLTICPAVLAGASDGLRGTGDLGVIVERATGSIQIVETTSRTSLARITGLGDLSHASVKYSRDQRHAYIFGRDGGLTQVDMLKREITHRIIQSGNSIGGAISQDGRLLAVANYEPGGVKVFDAKTLALVADIPTVDHEGQRSKVVGLVDAPRQRFVFSLFDAGEIWVADFSQGDSPRITRHRDVGRQPYDALITPDGRYYIAGLFGEDGMALLDLRQPDAGVQRIMEGYGRGDELLPVFKMPHLEGWAIAGDYAFMPAVGHHSVLVVDRRDWSEVARIPVHGQPIFVMASPDQHAVWVNFAYPDNDTLQVIEVDTLELTASIEPGPAVLHMEFTPRGEHIWVSVRDANEVHVYDAYSLERLARLEVQSPSGIFFTARAHRIGF
ncbi:Heme d1 biosynthesis protein NirF [Thioalkalivibrio nitratireducens DSM 14787]|uniref:Heme d1 biosynthesis protein NirF n=1 Tax=Thioalkalivibrio nitratireducens (strain DSM 14787 / UNIQEM 213 / ALEN2) TaxID=1255043 RepID=L0DUN6_THIND|nr:cytochrome D1 domain-containing protein [Thioalkalivibrio nitratireducens]AGA33309.1 Heme d1 biosynthesis protein NirF [Thioalkalivibrio nitratireducens DSM 14787]